MNEFESLSIPQKCVERNAVIVTEKIPVMSVVQGTFAMSGMSSLRKWSTNCEILSVGPPLAEMMGLPGGGLVNL